MNGIRVQAKRRKRLPDYLQVPGGADVVVVRQTWVSQVHVIHGTSKSAVEGGVAIVVREFIGTCNEANAALGVLLQSSGDGAGSAASA